MAREESKLPKDSGESISASNRWTHFIPKSRQKAVRTDIAVLGDCACGLIVCSRETQAAGSAGRADPAEQGGEVS